MVSLDPCHDSKRILDVIRVREGLIKKTQKVSDIGTSVRFYLRFGTATNISIKRFVYRTETRTVGGGTDASHRASPPATKTTVLTVNMYSLFSAPGG